MDLAARREPERRITRPRVLDVELVTNDPTRHRHPAGHHRVEQAVERRRIVVDHAIADTTISAQSTLARTFAPLRRLPIHRNSTARSLSRVSMQASRTTGPRADQCGTVCCGGYGGRQ